MVRALLIFCGLLSVTVLYSQTVLIREHSLGLTIPEIALLDIEPDNTPVNLGFNFPSEAGLPLVATGSGTNNSKWINYTNSLSPLVASRSIEVQINNGSVPDGVELLMDVSTYSGGGEGAFGISAGSITLSTAPQTCIDNIGGSYTGNGSNNGHQITYTLGISNYDELDANQSAVIELIFTLVDN